MFGFILTNASNIESVFATATKYRVDTLKVVTAWGLPWDKEYNRIKVARKFANLIVRTHAGDPASGKPYPHYEDVIAEIDPWYTIRRDIVIQIGNEPNAKGRDGKYNDPYGYVYHLKMSILEIKRRFPLAKIISTPLQQGLNEEAWITALFPATMQCEYTGVHAYEHETFVNSKRLQYVAANYPRLLYPPIVLCELGINSPVAGRINEYRQIAQKYSGALWYHQNDAMDIDPQYVLKD
jgi:hypothetical protein